MPAMERPPMPTRGSDARHDDAIATITDTFTARPAHACSRGDARIVPGACRRPRRDRPLPARGPGRPSPHRLAPSGRPQRRRAGFGLDLATLAAEQRRLARYAPATALSTCMHHYWVGLAATLDAVGHPFGERILGWVGRRRDPGLRARRGRQRRPRLAVDDPGRARRPVAGGSTGASCSARSARCGTGSASTPWTPATRRGP